MSRPSDQTGTAGTELSAPSESVPAEKLPHVPPPAPAVAHRSVSHDIRRYLVIGFLLVIAMVGGVGTWAAFANVSSAVIAHGIVVVESRVKRIQHRDGGIVGEIHVEDGDEVKAGDLLVRLDETLLKANLGVIVQQLVTYDARIARLEAERDGATSITFPKWLDDQRGNPEIAKVLVGETTLFTARQQALDGQVDQLKERIGQLDEQIRGLDVQQQAKEDEISLINQELAGLEGLLAKGQVPITRVIANKRERTRLEGERGALISQIAMTRGRISETELQVLQIQHSFREEVLKELRDAQAQVAGLSERRIAAEEQLSRTEIRAPQAGYIHELAVHTLGGVVTPGETLMQIVPEKDALVVEARISPTDIDQVHLGQAAIITFSAFSQRTTPQIDGHVVAVSPDLIQDPKTGVAYFTARVAPDPGQLERLGELKLLPGMPAEVFIRTGDRTVMTFLLKPLADQIRHTFREG